MDKLSLDKLFEFLWKRVWPVLMLEYNRFSGAEALVEDMEVELKIIEDVLSKAEAEEEGFDDGVKETIGKLREIKMLIDDLKNNWDEIIKPQDQPGLNNDDRVPNSDNHQGNEGQSSGSNESNCLGIGCLQMLDGLIRNLENWLNGRSKDIQCRMRWRDISLTVERIQKKIEKINEAQTSSERSYYQAIFKGGHNQQIRTPLVQMDADSEEGALYSKRGNPGMQPFYIDESELVGLEGRVNEVKDKLHLAEEEYVDKELSLVVVRGQPGVGKTTIVSKVFQDEQVRQDFPVRVWITATRPYKQVDLLKSLLKQFHKQAIIKPADHMANKDADELKDSPDLIAHTLRKQLLDLSKRNKRFLVVLDDVSETEGLVRLMKIVLLPRESKGSKILMTTSSEQVAKYWNNSWTDSEDQILKLLPINEGTELFKKRALRCHQKWQDDKGRKNMQNLVERCCGLPFIVEKAAAHFARTENWEEVSSKIQSELPFLEDKRSFFLSSYYKLPSTLKHCFLHLCMFPRASMVTTTRIVRLWIAEDFITTDDGQQSTPEEVAEGYLHELVTAGMVYALHIDETGRIRKVMVPCFWHMMMEKELEYQRFCLVLPSVHLYHLNQYRRLSIHDDVPGTTIIPQSVRSILSFVSTEKFPILWRRPCTSRYFLLKVLDLEGAQFKEVPIAMGKLHKLHYLGLRGTKVDNKLPKDMFKGLVSLETLDLKRTQVNELPETIDHLKRLRHLIIGKVDENGQVIPVRLPTGVVASFRNLQKLAVIDGSSDELVKELKHLKRLRWLTICNLEMNHGKDLCDAIKEMKALLALSVTSMNGKALDLDHIPLPQLRRQLTPAMPNKMIKRHATFESFGCLKHLSLRGKLTPLMLPKWILALPKLVKLRVTCTGLANDEIKDLSLKSDLFNLLVLELENYEGVELEFGKAGFPELQVLRLISCHELKNINFGNLDLPQLQKVAFRDCGKLKAAFQELESSGKSGSPSFLPKLFTRVVICEDL